MARTSSSLEAATIDAREVILGPILRPIFYEVLGWNCRTARRRIPRDPDANERRAPRHPRGGQTSTDTRNHESMTATFYAVQFRGRAGVGRPPIDSVFAAFSICNESRHRCVRHATWVDHCRGLCAAYRGRSHGGRTSKTTSRRNLHIPDGERKHCTAPEVLRAGQGGRCRPNCEDEGGAW